MSLLSVESLRCFCEAAKTLNFRAAARVVALTPAAFGQRIRALEQEVGESLFVRTTRSVRLSRAGLLLLPAAERAVLAVAECATAAKGKGEFPKTSVLLGTRHELGLSWILPEVDSLMAELPWLDLHLYFGSGSDLINRVRNSEIHCAVTSTAIHDPALAQIRIHLERYVLVGSRKLSLSRPLRCEADARGHTLIDIDDSLALYRYFRDAPKAPTLSFGKLNRFGTIEAIRQRVLAGSGVAVLPEYLVKQDLLKRRVVRLFPQVALLSDHFRLVLRSDDIHRPMMEALAAALARIPLR